MADFEKALIRTTHEEGGYANVSGDRGGETYRGIARNYNPDWAGWSVIDRQGSIAHGAIILEAEELVGDFYRKKYWSVVRGDEIKNQALAELIFDWSVNSGKAVREIQKVLNFQFGANLVIDGVFGSKTLAAINAANADALSNGIVNARIAYYAGGVSDGWLDSKFLRGLVNRARGFSTVGKFRAV